MIITNHSTQLMVNLLFALGVITSAYGTENTPAEGASLRLLSYNIRHGRGMDDGIDLKRIAAVIANQKPDLVALQEVDKVCKRSGNRDIAAELAKLLGMEHRFGKFMDFQGGEYGLAILSRFPIQESIHHRLPKGSEPRCALEVTVHPPGMKTPLAFVSIHNDWITEEIRVTQVQTLLDGLAERRHPIILAGDFNGEPSDASMKLLEKSGWSVLKKDDAAATLTFPSDKPNTEIDFFVIKGLPPFSYKHQVVDERMASDHRPIAAVIQLQ
ncbi:MAG: endonuclease/exonuclease/phosphatase family protein [Kiritimatiellae bacterium]|nr:endonuclease/exonuclease/phosphatase family protein [Kiritimatiellia bacterium]